MGEAANYAAGVAIAMISTGCNAVGLVCQKLTHRKLALLKEQQGDAYKKPRFYTQPLWLAGIVCMVAGAILSFAVFSFLGQSRASAMAAITILWNGILAAVFLGERFSAYDALVAGVIVCGAAIAVTFGASGSGSQPTTDLPSIVAVLSRRIVWIAAIVVILLWASAYYVVRRLSKLGKARTAGQVRLECYLRIFLSGIMTGVTGMLASSIVKSISGGIKHNIVAETASAWQLWIMIICLPFSLVMQLGFLNSALAQMDALEIVPPYQAGVICIGLAWGVVFLGDAETMSKEALGLFCLGCLVACCGVGLLAFKRRAVPWLDGLWTQLGWAWCLPRKGKGTHMSMADTPSSPTAAGKDSGRGANSFDVSAPADSDGRKTTGDADGPGGAADARAAGNADDDTIGLARDGSTDSIPQMDSLVKDGPGHGHGNADAGVSAGAGGSSGAGSAAAVDDWGASSTASTLPIHSAALPLPRPSAVGGARGSIISLGRIIFALPQPEPEPEPEDEGGLMQQGQGGAGDGDASGFALDGSGAVANTSGPEPAAASAAGGCADIASTTSLSSTTASRRSLSVLSSSSSGGATPAASGSATAVTNPLRLARLSASVPTSAAAAAAASSASGDGRSGGSGGGVRRSISASRQSVLSLPLPARGASGSIGGSDDGSGPVFPRLGGATPPSSTGSGSKMGRRMTIDDYDGLLTNEASSALAIDGGFTLLSSIGAAVSTLLADGARSRANSLATGVAGTSAGATAGRLFTTGVGGQGQGASVSPLRRRAASVEMSNASAPVSAFASAAGSSSAAGSGLNSASAAAAGAVGPQVRAASGSSANVGADADAAGGDSGSHSAAAATSTGGNGRPPRPLSGRPTDWTPSAAATQLAAGAAGGLGAITEDHDGDEDAEP